MFKETNHQKQLVYDTLLPVLLVFIPNDAQQHLLINDVVEQLLVNLTGKVHLLRIEETVHPAVVRSFDINYLPAFVLVLQGMELWRHEGIPAENLVGLLEHQIP